MVSRDRLVWIAAIFLAMAVSWPTQAGEIFVRGDGESQPVTIANIGDAGSSLEVSDVVIDDPTHFSLAGGGSCPGAPFDLAAGEQCTQYVEFTPQDIGEHTATLQVLSDADSVTNDSTALSGTALPGPQPEVEIAPDPMNFGMISGAETPVFDDFTVTNAGDPDTSFVINDLVLLGDDAFFIDSEGCVGMNLSAGDSCAVTIGFESNESGSFAGEITVQTSVDDVNAEILATTQVPDRLAFVVQPSTTMVNENLSPAVVVEVRDSDGVPVDLDDETVIELELSEDPSSQATLGGKLQRQVSNGQASFDDLSVDQVGSGFEFSAAATGLTGDGSSPFDVIAGVPDTLAFVDQPPEVAVVDEPFASVVTAEVLDSFGNRVVWDDATQISLDLIDGNPEAGLDGEQSMSVVAGLASFPSLSVDRAGEGYRLVAVDSDGVLGSSESDDFDVLPTEAAIEISSIDPPDQQVIGQPYTVNVQVNGVEPTGSVSVGDGTGAACQIELPQQSCQLTSMSVGTRALTASYSGDANNEPAGTSVGYEIVPASSALEIVEIDPPDFQAVNEPYTVRVELEGFDPAGTIVVDDGQGASCLIVWPGGDLCELSSDTVGSRTISAEFSGDGNNDGDSDAQAYQIVAGDPASLHFVVEPENTESSTILEPAVEVEVRDSDGNPVTGDDQTEIGLSLVDGASGAELSGGQAVSVIAGVAVFDTLSIDLAAGGYRLRASATGLVEGFSEPFEIFPGDPAELGFLVQPATTLVNQTISPPVIIEVRDTAGNRVVNDNDTAISLGLAGGDPSASLSGGGESVAEEGLVTFGVMSIDTVATGYQLVALDTLDALLSATSEPFNVVTQSSETTIGDIDPAETQTVGEPYFVAVEVTGSSPTGTVTVSDGKGGSCQFDLPAAGCEVISPEAGEVTVNAFYGGDENNASSNDSASYEILKAVAELSIVGIDPPAEQVPNQPYQVEIFLDGFQPTGAIEVADGLGSTCQIMPPETSCALSTATAGALTLLATYGGDANNESDDAEADYQIVPVDSETNIVGITPPDSQVVEEPYVVTVSVSGSAPTGLVTVADGEGAECTISLDVGQTQCALISDSLGTRSITASYPGDDLHSPSDDSIPYEIASSGPVAVEFLVEPDVGVADGPLFPRVLLRVVDTQGQLVTDDNSTEIEVRFDTNPPDASLGGTLLRTVSGGIVEFSDLTVDQVGEGYRLEARTPNLDLTPDVTEPFEVIQDGVFGDRFEVPVDELFRDRFEASAPY